jgi:hypothetical protein
MTQILTPTAQNRAVILAAIAGGTTPVLWQFKSGISVVWQGSGSSVSLNKDLVTLTSGYTIYASSCGMAGTLPGGAPATDTVQQNYLGLGLNNSAMAADDFAVTYWKNTL